MTSELTNSKELNDLNHTDKENCDVIVNGDVKKERENTASQCGLERVLPSLCLFVAFIVFGAMSNIFGPTLVHMGIILGANVAEMAFVFPCLSAGYIIGAILTSLLFDRFNAELQIFVICMMQGIMLTLCPWAPNLYTFYCACLVLYSFMGYFDSSCQPYTIRLWIGHRFQDTIFQTMGSVTNLGLFIGPLVVRPFVIELHTDEFGCNMTDNVTNQNNNMTNLAKESEESSPCTQDNVDGIETVRYPYAILGITMCCVSFTFVLTYCYLKKRSNVYFTTDTTGHQTKHTIPSVYQTKFFRLTFLTLNVIFVYFLLFTIMIPMGLLSTFIIKGLEWRVDKGLLMMSVFGGSQAVGRVLVIFASTVLDPVVILLGNVTITTLGFAMMMFVTSSTVYLMWISAVLVGIGISPTFSSMLLWTSKFVNMTGRIGAMLFISGSIGVMSGTALAGYMFEHYGHMWMVYICLPAAVIDMILLIVSYIFVKCYGRTTKHSRENGVEIDGEGKSESIMLKEGK